MVKSNATISEQQMEGLENALGFYPYGDENLVDISDNGDFMVPQDFRIHLLEKVAEGQVTVGDVIHARALKRLEDHATNELEHTLLYNYQQDVVRNIKSFLQYPEYDEQDRPIRHGYVKLPTATGKTAIFAHTVQEITNHIAGEQERLKTLVLVPGRDLVGQTVGTPDVSEEGEEAEEMARGFARFAPDLTVTEYHGGKKDLSGDVVVMTYQSMHRAVREGRFDSEMFDVVIGDEIHRGLGAATKQSLTAVIRDKLTVGFSATTEYGRDKKVKDILPAEIYRLELREAVDKGYLAPVRAVAITTKDILKATGRGEFKDEELAKLITSEWRNNTAINIASEFVAEGQQGIITCLPGENVRHARDIANRLSKENVVDAKTGKIRNIVAQVVHGEMDIKERRDIYRRYEAGQIDVLTAVDLLNEGWDSVQAKFLINLRPTTSQVLGTQRLGRILRPTEDGQIATVVEFIDNIEKPGDGLFTFYHAMGEKEVTQGKVLGGPTRPGGNPEDPLATPELPDDLKRLVARMSHQVLDERVFGLIKEADETVINIKQMAEKFGCSDTLIYQLVNKFGMKLSFYKFPNGSVGRAFAVEDQQTFEDAYNNRHSTILETDQPVKSLLKLARELGLKTTKSLQKILDENGIEYGMYALPNNQPALCIKDEDEQVVLKLPEFNVSEATEDDMTLNIFAREIGLDRKTITAMAEELGFEIKQRVFKGKRIKSLSSSERRLIIENLDPIAPEGAMSLEQYIKQNKTSAITIIEILSNSGLEIDRYRFRGQGNRTYRAIGLTQEHQNIVREMLAKKQESRIVTDEDPEVISIARFARENGVGQRTVEGMLNDLGIAPTKHIFDNHMLADGLNREQRSVLLSQPLFQVEKAPDGVMSINQFVRQYSSSHRSVREIAEKLGIELKRYRFSKRTVEGLTTEEQTYIIEAGHLGAESAPEGYVSVRQFASKSTSKIKRILEFVEDEGIVLPFYRFGARTSQAISPELQQRLIAELGLTF